MAPYDCHLRTGRLAAVASSIRVMGSVWCVIYGVGIAVDLVVGGLHSGYESVESLFVSLLFFWFRGGALTINRYRLTR